MLNEIYRFKKYLIFEWDDQLVHHHKILDLAEELIGKNIMIWSVGMFIKPTKSKRRQKSEKNTVNLDI